MEEYEVIRSRRRTLALEITRDCRVLVRAPLRTSQTEIQALLYRHRDWLDTHLARRRAITASAPPPPTAEELVRRKARTRERVTPRVEEYSRRMGVRPAGVTVTAARTRYGSCSGRDRLSFSCFLSDVPDAALDLVVVHELCHIREKNHGPRFYDLLSGVLPDWKERKKLLRETAAAEL